MNSNQSLAFILRRNPFREGSLIIDLYTKEEGRITVIARFSKKQSTRLKGMLEPFRLLDASWTGRGDVFTMTQTEEKRRYVLKQKALIQATYMNELLLRSFQNYQASPELFDQYHHTLYCLQSGEDSLRLMQFELALLAHCGYELNLWQEDQSEQAIQEDQYYRFQVDQGLERIANDVPEAQDTVISGGLLMALREPMGLSKPQQNELRKVLDRLLRFHLKGRTLYARRLLSE